MPNLAFAFVYNLMNFPIKDIWDRLPSIRYIKKILNVLLIALLKIIQNSVLLNALLK